MYVWGNKFNLPYSNAILDDMDEEMKKISQLGFINVTILAGVPKAWLSEGDYGLYREETAGPNQEVLYAGAMCSLYPCVQEFEATIRNNTLHTSVVSTTPISLNRQGKSYSSSVSWLPKGDFAVKSPCVIDGEVYDLESFSKVPGTRNKLNNQSPTDERERTIIC